LRELKREKRTVDDKIRETDGEINTIQEKYEDLISKQKLDLKDQEIKHHQVLDGMQFEVDFCK